MADRPMIGEMEAPLVPRRLIVVLTCLVVLGTIGTAASIVNAQATNAASKADVQRTQELTQRLTTLTEQLAANQTTNASEATAFRNDSRRQITSICVQIHAIATELQVSVPACPPVPHPSPTP